MPETIVFFDGVCNLCNASVRFILRHDRKAKFRFASLQGSSAEAMITDPGLKKTDSIVLYQNGRFYVKSTAVLRIASGLDFPFCIPAVFLPLPAFLRNLVYDLIARRRYHWFGRTEQCMLPIPGSESRFLP